METATAQHYEIRSHTYGDIIPFVVLFRSEFSDEAFDYCAQHDLSERSVWVVFTDGTARRMVA